MILDHIEGDSSRELELITGAVVDGRLESFQEYSLSIYRHTDGDVCAIKDLGKSSFAYDRFVLLRALNFADTLTESASVMRQGDVFTTLLTDETGQEPVMEGCVAMMIGVANTHYDNTSRQGSAFFRLRFQNLDAARIMIDRMRGDVNNTLRDVFKMLAKKLVPDISRDEARNQKDESGESGGVLPFSDPFEMSCKRLIIGELKDVDPDKGGFRKLRRNNVEDGVEKEFVYADKQWKEA